MCLSVLRIAISNCSAANSVSPSTASTISVQLLCSAPLTPLDFTNICRQDNIQELARADENFSVKEIHEFYGDFIPIDTDHYTLNLLDGLQLCRAPSQWKVPENQMFRQATDVRFLASIPA